MKQTTRLLALSALVLALMLGVFGAPALEAPSVAFAQGQVPAAPTGLTATALGGQHNQPFVEPRSPARSATRSTPGIPSTSGSASTAARTIRIRRPPSRTRA